MLRRLAIGLVAAGLGLLRAELGLASGLDRPAPVAIEEAAGAWAAYQNAYSCAQGTLRMVLDVDTDGDVIHQDDVVRLKHRGDLLLAETLERSESNVDRPPLYVFGLNSVYEFQLTRATQESEWWVSRVFAIGTAATGMQSRQVFRNLQTVCPVAIGGTQLADLVKQTEFALQRCSRLGDGTVEIEFVMEYSDAPAEKSRQRLEWCKCVLVPDLLWCIKRAESREANALVTTTRICTIQLADPDSLGFALPEIVNIESTTVDTSGRAGHAKQHYECRLAIPSKPPSAEEFTLSAFGFPEPVWGQRPGRPWRWYALASILLIAGGSCGIYILKRRAA